MRDKKAKRVALCGVITALAIVLGYIEHLIPFPIGIYGIKLGLANVCIVVMLYVADAKAAAAVNLTRIAVCGILFGSITSFAYSLAGGALSFLVMLALKKTEKFSTIGVSVCGAIAHNLAQICVAIFLFDELKIAFYFPVLLLCGTLTGIFIGTASLATVKLLNKNKAE